MTDKELMQIAKDARLKAYVPYSKFKVGAALLTIKGKVYTGCNIENASYGLTNCAERTAIFKAVSEGESDFDCLAVAADTQDPVAPCGACRQVMVEFFRLDQRIILGNTRDLLIVKTVGELLPGAFKQEDLNEQNRL